MKEVTRGGADPVNAQGMKQILVLDRGVRIL